MSPVDTKVCPGCRHELALSQFWNNRTAADGEQRYCKGCLREMQLESARRSTDLLGNLALAVTVVAAIFVWSFVAEPTVFSGPAPVVAYTGAA